MRQFFQQVIRLRYVILTLMLGITLFLGFRASQIVLDFSTRSLFISSDPEIGFLGEHRRLFGDDDNHMLILFKSENVFTPAFMHMLNDLTNSIAKIEMKRPRLKIDVHEAEREFLGVAKGVSTQESKEKQIKKNVKDNFEQNFEESSKEGSKEDSKEGTEEEFEEDFEEEIIDEAFDEEEFDTMVSIVDAKPGSLVQPVERALSLVNTKQISGQKGEDGIHEIQIAPFLSNEELKAFKKNDLRPLTKLKEATLKSHLYKRKLISEDGKTVAIFIKLDDAFVLEPERTPVVDRIEVLYENYKKEHKEMINKLGVEFAVTGIPITQREYSRFITKDLFFFFFVSSLVMGLLLFLIFRKLHGVLLPLIVVSLAAIATFGIMELTNETLNLVNNIIPTLILVIGLSDTIHLIHRYHREINVNHKEKKEALLDTFIELFKACFITSFTTAIGFFSLLSAQIDIIERLGVYSGIGIVLSFLFIILLLPGILFLLPIPKFTKGETSSKNKKSDEYLIPNYFLKKINTFNQKQPLLILFLALLALLVSIFFVFKLNVNTRMLEEMKEDNPVYIDTKFSEKNLTGILPIEINIKAQEKNGVLKADVLLAMDAFKTYLETNRKAYGIGTIQLISDYIKENYWVANGENPAFYKIPENTDGVLADDLILNYFSRMLDSDNGRKDMSKLVANQGRVARISITQNDVGLKNFFKVIDKIKAELNRLFGSIKGVETRVTGGNYVAYRALNHIIEDMLTSLFIAFLFITLVMIFMIRSVKIGLLSMIPNVLPMLVTMGVMGAFDIVVRTSTVLIFSISLGIAVDDSIHFLTRYKEEATKTASNSLALERTMAGTGRAIIFTSVLIVCGVMPLIFSEFVAIMHYSILTAVTMLTALLSNIFLLPSLLKLMNPLKLDN